MKDVYLEDSDNFYQKIKKYKEKEVHLHLSYDKKDIVDDKSIEEEYSQEIKFKIQAINAANIKDKEKRYSYLYDVVCQYLDCEFREKNICEFKNNRCISVRMDGHCKESENGCCYGKNRGLCKNFIDGRCTIKSISCKLFTCRYLKKKNIQYRIDNIPLLKYFFNKRQKYIIEYSIFKDKDEIMKLLLKKNRE